MTGITTIPRTHNGEGLAYISPQEAVWLRQMGGGVPTDPQTGQRNQSQQLLGPGNVPTFVAGMGAGVGSGQGSGGTASAGHGSSSSGTGPSSFGASFSANPFSASAFSGSGHGDAPAGGGGPGHGGGGFPGYRTPYTYGAPGARVAVVEEEEEEPNVPTPEEIAERQAKLDAAIQRGADRLRAIHASLGYGPVGPRYGETSDGTKLFPGSTPVAIDQIPAWRGLLGSPAGPAIQVGLEQTQPTGGTPQGLLERVQLIANSLRPVEEAATGGEVRNYDLGGLVNSMLLQAARSRDNIPTNMVS